MDAAPIIINDRTYVPVRYIGEAFGYNIRWSPDENLVIITSPSREQTMLREFDDFFMPETFSYPTYIVVDKVTVPDPYCEFTLQFYDKNGNSIPCTATETITIYNDNGERVYSDSISCSSSDFNYYQSYCDLTFAIPVGGGGGINYGSSSRGILYGRIDFGNGMYMLHETVVDNLPCYPTRYDSKNKVS